MRDAWVAEGFVHLIWSEVSIQSGQTQELIQLIQEALNIKK